MNIYIISIIQYIFFFNRNLSNNQLSGSIPSELGNLENLNQL